MADDVVQLVKDDHRRAERLIDELRQSRDRAVFEELARELDAHTTLEEEVLYPAVRSSMDNGGELADEGEKEHDKVDGILETMRAVDVDDDRFLELLDELEAAIQHHVEEEEQEMLPEFADAVPAAERRSLGADAVKVKQRELGEGGVSGQATVDLTKAELYERAKDAGIEGRSTMDKEELAEALDRQ